MTMLLQVGSILLLLSCVEGENLIINWKHAGRSSLVSSAASLSQPVMSLAPCPCDLTAGACDPGCCCDEDCFEFEKASFICQEGLEGGQQMNKHPDYFCQYQGPYSPEWHDLLCIVTENTPYLGYFYQHEPVIRDFQKYMSRVRVPNYSYEDTSYHTPGQNFHQYYVFGSTVETIFPSNESRFRDFLSLPQQLLNGICVQTVPIHFLEEFNHKCPLLLSPKVCQTEALLSPATYLRETDGLISDSLEIPQVIGNLTSLARVNASIEYECVLDDTAKFIKIHQKEKYKDFSEFGKGEEGHLDIVCKGSNLPHYNSASQKCENVVLSVEYNFGWSGSSITKIQAKIKIGNVPLSLERPDNFSIKTSQKRKQSNHNLKHPKINKSLVVLANPKLSLVQHFSVSFHHTGFPDSIIQNLNADLNATEGNVTDQEEDLIIEDKYSRPCVIERSGNPGYQLGRPLLAGYAIYGDPVVDNILISNNTAVDNSTAMDNNTTDQLMYVNMNGTTGLFILHPAATGECQETERVTFGVDMISTCHYHWTHTHHCNQLRESLQSLLRSFIQADVVAKLGWPNITVENDFLTVINDDGEIVDSKNDEAVKDEMVSNESGAVKDEAVKAIAVEECRVPHALEYRMVYQDISQPPTNPLYQLVGVLARFHMREIQLRDDTNTGQILVTTSVTFIHNPRPSRLSRFWKRMEDRWCFGGTCWREVLQPWTHAHGAHTTHLTSLMANTVLLLVLAVPVLVIALSPRQ